MRSGYSDATLIVFGHGSTLNGESGSSVLYHASRLSERRIFSQVCPAFWKQEPNLNQVLARAQSERIYIVPLFISEGHFSEFVVPAALGMRQQNETAFSRVQQLEGRFVVYCRPVGTHPGMTEVVLARAWEVGEEFPFPSQPSPTETTLFIAGHGTPQNCNSRAAIDRQVEEIRSRNIYKSVYPVFIEEEPRIGDAYRLASTKSVALVPFFISDGLHVTEDIPVLLGEPRERVRQRLIEGKPTWRNPTERHGKRIWYSKSVGSHPQVTEIILARVSETEAEKDTPPVRGID